MHLFRLLLSLLLAIESTFVCAQFTDNFSDGNIHQNPTWNGDTAHFNVINDRLQLTAPAVSDTSFLITPSVAGLEAHWYLSVTLNFNPSSSNYCLIYLMSDRANLKGELNGYYVRIGGASDDVSLFRQDGKNLVQLINGRDKALDKSNNELRIDVKRDKHHNWILKSDTGSSSLISEGSVTDSTYVTSRFFGITCRYTSTRSDKFGFDDVSVSGKIYTDLNPPVILNHELINERTWEIRFDEKLDQQSIAVERIHPGFENGIVSSIVPGPDLKSLSIEFMSPFPHGLPLTLGIDSIADTLGNAMKLTIINSLFNDANQLRFKDVIINEIMFDPSPPQHLPQKEYLEIYNRSEFYLDLSSWKLADESDTVSLPKAVIAPNEVVLLISEDDSAEFQVQSSILLLPEMISLNNSGEVIMLLGPANKLIDTLHYLPSWLTQPDKKDGGWALELINPDFICSLGSNWIESADLRGGTPGEMNSAHSLIKTEHAFEPDFFQTLSDSLITLNYSGEFIPLMNPDENFVFNPPLNFSGIYIGDGYIDFNLNENPEYHTTYELNVRGVMDCYQQEVNNLSLRFRFPEKSIPNDLVLNEILFNPYPNGSDFIEIYNRSDRYLDLSQCVLSTVVDGKLSKTYPVSDHFLGMRPHTYLAVCDDSNAVKSTYPSIFGRFHQVPLPPFNDNYGHVILLNKNDSVLDQLYYSEEMHFSLIEDVEGISLERISADSPGLAQSNWHSASSAVGYASPGYRNSQSGSELNSNSAFSARPSIFSPDNDGYNDVLQITYSFKQEGYVGSVSIMDKEGQIVRKLASNILLGREGHFYWDGINEQRKKASVGYYIVFMELFNASGEVSRYKTTVVLAHHL